MCGKEYPVLHHCVLVSNNDTMHLACLVCAKTIIQYLPIFVLSLFIWGLPGGIWGFWLLGAINNKRKRMIKQFIYLNFWFICRVLYAGKERLMYGCDFVFDTPSGKEANVNNSTNSKTFITYRRARQKMAHSSLAVTEICIIIASKVLKNLEIKFWH